MGPSSDKKILHLGPFCCGRSLLWTLWGTTCVTLSVKTPDRASKIQILLWVEPTSFHRTMIVPVMAAPSCGMQMYRYSPAR